MAKILRRGKIVPPLGGIFYWSGCYDKWYILECECETHQCT